MPEPAGYRVTRSGRQSILNCIFQSSHTSTDQALANPKPRGRYLIIRFPRASTRGQGYGILVPLVTTIPAEPTEEDCRREIYTYRVSARKTCGLLSTTKRSQRLRKRQLQCIMWTQAKNEGNNTTAHMISQAYIEWVWSPVCHSSYPLFPPFHYATL